MGIFLACTAFAGSTVAETSAAIDRYLKQHGVSHDALPGTVEPHDDRDAQIFAPVNNWVVVLWPAYFSVHDIPLARAIAADTGWLLSTVHICDSDFWEHLAVEGTEELHRFCWSLETLENHGVDPARFSPDAGRLATRVGVPHALLAPYLVTADQVTDGQLKAHPDDECPLLDCWVFTDFWSRLGIRYPDIPTTRPVAILRLSHGFDAKLPVDA